MLLTKRKLDSLAAVKNPKMSWLDTHYYEDENRPIKHPRSGVPCRRFSYIVLGGQQTACFKAEVLQNDLEDEAVVVRVNPHLTRKLRDRLQTYWKVAAFIPEYYFTKEQT